MEFSTDTINQIATAEAKALATSGPQGINVVPVSVVEIENSTVVLYNFFMGKTVENICHTPTVAFTAWSGLSGIQIKATADYQTSGELYAKAKVEMQKRFPDRTLHGIILLTPTAIYDISAGEQAGRLLAGG
jgi:predicted pyridoxine 5'-phosphate oxidase superfamily flavin-nucleotide-binding protein